MLRRLAIPLHFTAAGGLVVVQPNNRLRMSIFEWTLIHALIALLWLWILIWGGAKKLEGWGAFFLIDWLAARLDKEQLRLYALLSLVIQVIWYVIGAINPDWRGFP